MSLNGYSCPNANHYYHPAVMDEILFINLNYKTLMKQLKTLCNKTQNVTFLEKFRKASYIKHAAREK